MFRDLARTQFPIASLPLRLAPKFPRAANLSSPVQRQFHYRHYLQQSDVQGLVKVSPPLELLLQSASRQHLCHAATPCLHASHDRNGESIRLCIEPASSFHIRWSLRLEAFPLV